MAEVILNAIERTMKPKQCREAGFTPGAIYGGGITRDNSVQFETSVLNRVISAHGRNAKVWVVHGNNKDFGIVKEVQRNPVSNKIIHVSVNLISQDHEVKMQIPIFFEGQEKLSGAQLQVYKTEVEVTGKAILIPNAAYVDVSAMTVGDTITSAHFNFAEEITVIESEDEVYGVIRIPQILAVEEPEDEAESDDETETEEE